MRGKKDVGASVTLRATFVKLPHERDARAYISK